MKKNFRFYDNRQKYLLFVTTTNEKNQIADAIRPHVNKIKPQKPGIKIFDAGMGDGSLLMNVMRQCHEAKPNVPLLVCTKEISIEDVRLGLEKLPDRFVEHKNTVFVISNLHYAEAANLKSKNEVKQKKINWNIIKLKGDTSLEFAQQLRKQNEFLEKKWNIEINKKSGNHTYKEPSVMVIYREDQEFNVNELIPTKKKSDNKFKVVVAPGPNEIKEASNINALCILDNGKALDISQLAALIKDSSFVVANDTGPAHMTAHLGSKGIALFGSHTTPFKVSIERKNFKAIQAPELSKLSAEKVFERLSEIIS